jgi:opacity protein-like surface antigen
MGTFQDVMVSQGTCSAPVKGVISCTIGDMASGAVVTAEVVFTAPDEAASMALSASVTGSVADPTGANNTHGDAASVIAAVDLVIQGKTKGSGAIGWLEMLLLTAAVAASWALRNARFTAPCLIAVAAALVLAPAGTALAQGQWYVQGSIGKLDLDYSASDLTNDLSNLGWTITSPVVDSDDTAWKLVGGIAVNQYVAFEAGYVSLGEVTTQFSATVDPGEIDDILADTYAVHPYQGDGLVAAAVLIWPVNPDRFSVNLKGGVFAWKSETDIRVIQGGTGSVTGEDDGTSGMYGLGIEWKINPTWALTADWERYKMNQWLDVPMIGLKIYF